MDWWPSRLKCDTAVKAHHLLLGIYMVAEPVSWPTEIVLCDYLITTAHRHGAAGTGAGLVSHAFQVEGVREALGGDRGAPGGGVGSASSSS